MTYDDLRTVEINSGTPTAVALAKAIVRGEKRRVLALQGRRRTHQAAQVPLVVTGPGGEYRTEYTPAPRPSGKRSLLARAWRWLRGAR